MTTQLTKETVAAMAELAGYAMDEADAARVARAIGPALAGFSKVEAPLPCPAEPSGFVAEPTESVS